MRRTLLPLLICSALLAATGGPASAAYRIGISDQQPSTFTNPLFAPLKTTLARYVTPWDVMYRASYRSQLTAWINAAVAAGQRPLIAFETSHTKGHERKAPTSVQYTKAIKRFHTAFPEVKDIQAWNEVNRCQSQKSGGYVIGQPICRKPKMAALYYLAARRVFKGAKITGLDILDGKNINGKDVSYAIPYIRAFLKYAKPRPQLWGIHNYADTNRFSSSRTKALLKATGSGQVWLTETGGIVSLGKNFPYSTKRAAKALGCTFTLAKSSKRITRIYIYSFNGIKKGTAFDAGLINPDNTLRPGYNVVKNRKAGRCHK
ncbi:MAG: hypothetical protein QOG68_1873 [Solirubrobacteraceae bacterium]|nr:hypothetical protein [Solirubrobacteraceae bacterium]